MRSDAAQPVFAWADDGLHVFASEGAAVGYVEAVDVENGVWDGFWSLDGHAIDVRVVGNSVTLHATDRDESSELDRRLAEAAARGRFHASPMDRRAVANEVLRDEWSVRWPRWPRWLDRRLHGPEPPQVP